MLYTQISNAADNVVHTVVIIALAAFQIVEGMVYSRVRLACFIVAGLSLHVLLQAMDEMF